MEHSQERQRELDGIVTWYFNHVMEFLPLMLQAALLLLGCALSRYLWDINTTVASVVIGATSFGVLFYLFIVVVGTASVSCPYQTPVANLLRLIVDILRHIPEIGHRFSHIFRRVPLVPSVLRSVLSAYTGTPAFYDNLIEMWDVFRGVDNPLLDVAIFCWHFLLLPIWLIEGVGKAIIWPVGISRRVYSWLQRRSDQQIEQQMAVMDLHCISWTLRTSLDRSVRLAALNYLTTMTLADFDPTVVVDCFDILISCIKVTSLRGGHSRVRAACSSICPGLPPHAFLPHSHGPETKRP